LVALALADGRALWSRELGAPVEGGVALGKDVVFVGAGLRGVGAGEGCLAAVALDSGEVRWRMPVAGTVRSTPVAHEARVYVTAGDGALHIFDLRDGHQLGRIPVAARAVPMPAGPVLVHRRGAYSVVVGAYSARFGHDPGRLVALNPQGHSLWQREVPGNILGTPVLADRRRLYVTYFGERPSSGTLLALHAHTGKPLWEAPFTVIAEPGGGPAFFSASPLVYEDTVYVGSLNHQLYALDAATSALRWESTLPAGLAAPPAWVEGLVVVGANDGRIHALDASTGAHIWDYPLGGNLFTEPFVHAGVIIAGSDTGELVALPWHLGRYVWAAERLEKDQRYREAGDCRALAAHFAPASQPVLEVYRPAEAAWLQAGEPERAAQLWDRLGKEVAAAGAFQKAGLQLQLRDPCRAARYFSQAAFRYARLRDAAGLNACTRALSRCAALPYISVRPLNTTLVQWEAGQLSLEIRNDGKAALEGVLRLVLEGALSESQQATIEGRLGVGQAWTIPLALTLYEPESQLEVEVCYSTAEYGELRGLFQIPLRAAARPRPLLDLRDVGVLHLQIGAATGEGITINTGDVGLLR